MDHPHVEKLYYRVISSEHPDYDNAPPITGETQDFKWNLDNDQLAIVMKTPCATENEATEIVDEYLRGWEVVAGLSNGPDSLVFKLDSSVTLTRPKSFEGVEDRGITQESSEIILLVDEAITPVSHDKFPPLPMGFKVSPEVLMMYYRYKLHRQGKETLLGLAYWCLNVIEYSGRGKNEAADQYRIDLRVLRKLGELCGNRGDGCEYRKHKNYETTTLLKPTERTWIRAVVKRLILRAGEYAYDPVSKRQMITMVDFPSLMDHGGKYGSDKGIAISDLKVIGRPSGTGLVGGD